MHCAGRYTNHTTTASHPSWRLTIDLRGVRRQASIFVCANTIPAVSYLCVGRESHGNPDNSQDSQRATYDISGGQSHVLRLFSCSSPGFLPTTCGEGFDVFPHDSPQRYKTSVADGICRG
jgi:hypothetical protein